MAHRALVVILLCLGVLSWETVSQARTNYTFRATGNSFSVQLAPGSRGALIRYTAGSVVNGVNVGGQFAPNVLMRHYLRLNRRLVPMRTGTMGGLSTNAPPRAYQLTR